MLPVRWRHSRARNLLTEEQAAEVDVEALDRFLASPLAQEIRQGRNILREYRFTLLMDAREYDRRRRGRTPSCSRAWWTAALRRRRA